MSGCDDMSEAWRPIAGFPAYQVSNLGRVRRILTNLGRPRRKPLVLRRKPDKDGYIIAELWADGACKWAKVSRLVLLAFVGPPPSRRHHAAHWNGARTDNRLTNLRWATPKENSEDQRRHGTWVRGERQGQARLTEDLVREIRRLDGEGVPRCDIVRKIGAPLSTVYNVIVGNSWRHVQ